MNQILMNCDLSNSCPLTQFYRFLVVLLFFLSVSNGGKKTSLHDVILLNIHFPFLA